MPATPSEPQIVKTDPDPSSRTQEQLQREIGLFREIVEAKFDCFKDRIDEIQKFLDHRQEAITAEVTHLERFHNERFRGIDKQFTERDIRVDSTARDTKVAVDAALQAAEKARSASNESFAIATSKSEAGITKQIDAIGRLMETTAKASDEKIEDLKSRLSMIEGRGHGVASSWAFAVGGFGIVAAVIGIVISLNK